MTDPAGFISAYQAGALSDFFALAPNQTSAALGLPRTAQNDALVTALARYASKLAAPPAVFAALEQLRRPDVRAVVTGQQVALLLGPMFTVTKAVSAINLARRLTSESRPVVPIFWLATQDHDSAEIDHAYLMDGQEVLHRLALPLPAQVPAGRIRLQPEWLAQIRNALTGMAGVNYRTEVFTLLERTAACAESFADWFAALLYALLGDQGLVIVNPLEPDIAPLLAPLLAAELAELLLSAQAINQAAEALKQRGFEPQLGRGEGATNLFLEEDGVRRLLRCDGSELFTEARRYRREELLAILAQEPSLLTPAAGLRPVAQDFLLPTAVTVVGPGELRYMAQLKGVYEARGVAMPLLWPRASATLLEPPAARLLDKHQLAVGDIIWRFEATQEAVLLKLHGHGQRFDEALARLKQEMAALLDEVQAIDPTVRRPVARGRGQLARMVTRLRGKAAAALARQDETTARQLRRLALHLRPEGVPQERLLSPVSFFLKFGTAYVMRQLLTLPPEGEHAIRL